MLTDPKEPQKIEIRYTGPRGDEFHVVGLSLSDLRETLKQVSSTESGGERPQQGSICGYDCSSAGSGCGIWCQPR